MAVESTLILQPPRPKRPDARRNYDKIVAAARNAFAASAGDASLEEIARNAGVGIGTLYRNFPNRQALLEAVYVGEVENLCAVAGEIDELSPWEALRTWLERFIGYLGTKRTLAEELFKYVDRDAQVFTCCREAMYAAGEPLLQRAQAAGEVRPDVTLEQVLHLTMGIVKGPADPAQVQHILGIALDGLRYRPGD